MRGIFSDEDLPFIEIEVRGKSPDFVKMNAIVDTGNNGHLQLPYKDAFPLGLTLEGMEGTTMSDGTTARHFVCRGRVKLDGKEEEVPIDVYPQCPTLIGNKLLKALKKKVVSDADKKILDVSDNA